MSDRDRPDRVLRSPRQLKEACSVVALRPCAHHTIDPEAWSGDRGQVPLPAAIGDLINADRDQPLEPAVVEVIGDDALHDLSDRVPPDLEQASDRGLGHLLRQPRHHILEVRPGGPTAPPPDARRNPGSAAAADSTR
jgi:hypothetical protein